MQAPMVGWRVVACVALSLAGFAGNSLLCRAALRDGGIDPLAFTTLRLASGALVLCLLVALRPRPGGPVPARRRPGDWPSAFALLAYALLFALAYRHVGAATGALLLFGAVQLTMLGAAAWHGESFAGARGAGLGLALAGVAALLLPGWRAPPIAAAAAMLASGVAWGLYSLRGRRGGDALADTSGNFLRSLAPLALVLAAACMAGAWRWQADLRGIALAVASGALASGLGYALWYAALPWLSRTLAGSAQLAVPVLTALGGTALLGEPLAGRVMAAGGLVLGGLALVLRNPGPGRTPES